MSAQRADRLGWHVRRLRRMSPGEVAWRARDQAVQVAWSRRRVGRDQMAAGVEPPTGGGRRFSAVLPAGGRRFSAVLPAGVGARVPEEARKAVLAAAGRLMRGEWEMLGVARTDLVAPDWFHDPVTGRRAPSRRSAFRIDYRVEEETGNVKQIWELSRLQHLTVLAAAWFLSHDESYAERAADQLRSWWRENPFLTGIHWTSGIEIGLRLISMAWIRRLLDDWPKAAGLFEDDELAVRQIWWHQRHLATFRSRGSSANNHVIAEAAGQLVACCAFPWFPQSRRWRQRSARLLERELIRNTFPSGVDRELASDYHCFVAELGLLAAIEAAHSDRPLRPAAWRRLCAMTDSAAALLDERGRPPRQGGGDEGRAVLLDAPAANRWPSLLALGEMVFGRLDWWPRTEADAASTLIGAFAGARRDVAGRPAERPWRFADAGITLLRTPPGQSPEIWCRCDGGPHGFPSIAAHAHADALSVEVRCGGVEILADPGTYSYHGEPQWRSYFRSTIAHSTVEVAGQDQSASGGPFLWLRHANGSEIDVAESGDLAVWTAEHDGYRSLRPPARHRRSVRLDRGTSVIDITDEIGGDGHSVVLAFHLGPDVHAELGGDWAALRWPGPSGPGTARLDLPPELRWSLHRGETDPILGWYSSGLGLRVPAFALIGRGRCGPGVSLSTRLAFADVAKTGKSGSAPPAETRRLAHSPSTTQRSAHSLQARRGKFIGRQDERAGA